MRGRQILFLSMFIIAVMAIAGIPTKSQIYGINADPDPDLIAGRNVNMVSGITLPDGDPWLQRQNEPSIAVSTRNPLHLLAGANDYRTVDMPFSEGELPGAGNVIAAGDAWLGVFKSLDGGESWKSTLLDGYPQQNNLSSPLNDYQAAADPVVRAGTNGLFFYSGIVFNRLEPKDSAVFVARFIDNNNDEEGDPIQHIDTNIIDALNGNRFKDKPWIAVDIPKKNAKTVTIAGQSIQKSNVYLVYSVFEGEGINLESKIMFSRSTDCGNSWEDPIEISLGHHLNQGATIAVDPRGNGHVFVAWRRFASGEGQTAQSNAIIIARSTNGGKAFPDVIEVSEVPGPFDQPTSTAGNPLPGTAFRTNSYPTMAIDKKGRIYLVWAQRDVDLAYPNDSRVLIATSKDGFIWTTPMTVENSILSANGSDCHEFMPSIAFAGGRLILAWYDTRKDYCPDVSPFYICDSSPIRHTVDVRVAQGQLGEFPVFQPSIQVSRYLWAMWEGSPGSYYFSQVQFNPPNYPLFMGGTAPFHGDYIEIAPSPALVQSSKGVWRFNTESTDSQQFHLAWTDNRDVRPPENNNWEIYNPPASSQPFTQSQFLMTTPCTDPQNTGMRNQNIYTSCIISVMEAGSPGNNKPLGTLGTNPATGEMIPRAFVIFVKNPTEALKSYRLQIMDGPDHGTASFLEFDMLEEIDVSIAPYSSISRPLFVSSTDENDTVTIDVFEIDGPGGSSVPGGARITIVINSDETNPDVTGDLATTETHDPDIASPNIVNWTYVNPNIVNPNIVNPNIMNPNIVNPNIVNPNIVNPNIVNPNIVNPNIMNPNIVNPNIVNPNIVNPNIVNSSIEDADVTDIEWTVTNVGNTVSSYTFKIFARESLPRGIYAQLLVYKVHLTPATDGAQCELKQTPHHELLLNIVNPNIVNPNIVNPNIVNPNIVNAAIENATFFLAPGEEAKTVLRLIDPDPGVTKFLQSGKKFKIMQFAESLGAAAGSQAVDSDDAAQGDTTVEADSTELIITTGGLPDGTVGLDYLTPEFQIVRLEAAGGDGTFFWSVNSELLPPGLGFTNDGIISGIPQDDPSVAYPHIYSFLVQVVSGGEFDTQNLSITINSAENPTPPLNIETATLPSGTVGNYYGYTLQATGGIPPRLWSTDQEALPPGLSLDSAGVISGTIEEDPSVVPYPHDYDFIVLVTDSNEDTDTQPLSITVSDIVYPDLTISGTIADEYGSAVQGVSIYGLPHAPQTDGSGYYSDNVPHSWSGTITPFKAGYTFYASSMDPSPSRTYTEITTDQMNQDFVAATISYTIAGTITYNGAPLAGVAMNGLPGTPSTNSSGYYSAPVPHYWSGTVTPGLPGYAFDPPSRTYDPVISDFVNQDYIASSTGGVVDDPYEPNDDFGSAAEITAGTLANLQLFDDDWFKIYVDDNMDLKLTLSGVSENNIDFGMCDSSGKYLVGGLSSSNQDTIHFHTSSSGYYYIRVPYTWGGDLQNTYTLTAEISGNLGLGQVSGRVTDSTNNPLHVRVRVFDRYSYRKWNTLTDAATGEYRMSMPPGSYKIRFITSPILDYYGGINYLSRYFGGNYSYTEAPLLEVQAGATISGIDGHLVEGGTITGTVTDLQGNPIEGAYIRVRDLDGYSVASRYSDGSGQYAIERLFTDYYKVFVRSWTENHGIEWYNDRPSFDEADAVYAETGQNTSGIDFQLTEGGNVEGRVIDVNGGVEGVQVVAFDSSQTIPFLYPSAQIPQIALLSTWTDQNGDFFMGHLPGRDVSLYFNTNNTHHVPEWYDDELDFEDSVAVPIQAGQITWGIDAELAEAGSIAGRVTDSSGNGIKDVLVWIFNLDDAGYYQANVYTDDEGYYQIDHIPEGNVKVRFRPNIYTSPPGNWAVEWYNDKHSYAAADQVTVVANQTTSGIDAVLADNGGNIQGRVINGGGQGIGGVQVIAYDGSIQAQVSFSYTDSDGYYTVPRIPTCDVKLAFFTDSNKLPYASGFYNNQSSYENAAPISVIQGQTTTLPDVVLSNRPNLTVTTSSLSSGTVATPYSDTLSAAGGTLNYHWSLAPGSSPLPNGLYLKSTGEIEGIPTTEGTFQFTAQVVDSSYPPQEALSQNLSITINTYAGSGVIISGRVTSEGFPLGGVILDGLPGSIQTNASGDYIAVVSSGWSGTVTPILPGYVFTPLNRSYDNVTANQIDQNYTTSVPFTISGTVWLDGQGLPGVVMTGFPGDPTTDGNGFYTASIPSGWSGTVIPSKEGHTFDPPSKDYVNVASDQMDQDYDATSLTLEWVARYDGPAANSHDRAYAMATDSTGNIYVTGSSAGSGTSGDIATIKYDSAGTQLWEARYNGPENGSDVGNAIAVDSTGNVYVTGYGGYNQSQDYVTLKYDSSGNQVWIANYNSPGNYIDRANAIAVDSSQNVYVTGRDGNGDYATVKYDSNGNQVWTATYDGPANNTDYPVDIAVDGLGNVYVTGYSRESSTGDDYATIKYDSDGNQVWIARHDSIGGSDRPIALVLDAAANVYVTGKSPRSGTSYDYATIKYDTDGNQVWIAWYDNNFSYDDPQDITLDPSGNVYVTGEIRQTYPDYDYATVKYNSAGVEQWAATYDGPENDRDSATSIAVDSAGNVFVTGESIGNGVFNEYATVKYDSMGGEVWAQRFDGSSNGDDVAAAMVVDSSGNILVTGGSHGSSTGNDYATIKYDSDGNQHWLARYSGPTNEENINWLYGDVMAMDASDNVYVSGYSYGNGTSNDYTTVKFDSSGNQVWEARYNGPGNYIDYAEGLAVDSSGNVYVTGETYLNNDSHDYATVKYDSAGNQQWAATYDGPANGNDRANAIVADASGNAYVTGWSEGIGTYGDCTTIKYDSAGNQIWIARYDGPANFYDEGMAIALDTSGNVYIVGSTDIGPNDDILIIKYDSGGNELWIRTYDGPENQSDSAYFIAFDSSDNVYVCGQIGGSNSYDFATVKYDSAGNFQWAAHYDGPGHSADYPLCLAVDSADNVYVTGWGSGSDMSRDFATIKYDAATGNELWVRTYEGESNGSSDYGSDIAFDSSGNVYVSGRSGGSSTLYDSACATIKYDTDGNQLWIAKYKGPANGFSGGFAIFVNSIGEVYVGGIGVGIGTGFDFIVLKYRQ